MLLLHSSRSVRVTRAPGLANLLDLVQIFIACSPRRYQVLRGQTAVKDVVPMRQTGRRTFDLFSVKDGQLVFIAKLAFIVQATQLFVTPAEIMPGFVCVD